LDLHFRKRLANFYIWSASYGAGIWTLRKVDQKYLENFEMRCWRRMEKISWSGRVRNEEVSQTVKEERIILPTINRRKLTGLVSSCIGNCLVKHMSEGKIK
jgi:hypothetical protein